MPENKLFFAISNNISIFADENERGDAEVPFFIDPAEGEPVTQSPLKIQII